MYKNIIILPSGAEISAGADARSAIRSLRLTRCVNSGSELAPGSVCAAMVEGELILHGESPLSAGMEVTLYKEDSGVRQKMGLFTLEKPTTPCKGRLRFTGYDRVAKLDKDLTAWLSVLEGFPYTALEFAQMVCAQCGVTLLNADFGNSAYPVQKFTGTYTGRQLMGFVTELAGGYCHADPDGSLSIEYYSDFGGGITAGELYLGAGERADYAVQSVDSVCLRLGQGLYPAAGENPYILSGNPLLSAVDGEALAALEVIQSRLPGGYVPCTLELPERQDIQPGHIITVAYEGGSFRTLVMEKVDGGGKSRVTCTGARLRPQTAYDQTPAQAAREAVQSMTQADVFNKLTDYGTVQGFYLQDGKLYINAELVQIVNLVARVVESVLGTSALRIDGASVKLSSGGMTTFEVNNEAEGRPILYMDDREDGAVQHRLELTPHHLRLGGADTSGCLKLQLDTDGTPRLSLCGGDSHRLSWQANENGTYTLIGT